MATRSAGNAAGTGRCVAVDLGPRFVRVVEVEQSGGEARIVRRGAAALPPNCWNDVTANREAMAASIREAMSSAGVVAKSIAVCLPRRLVTVRFARLPQAPPEQLRGMIEFEAQQYILFPLAEVILDYHVPTGIGSGLTNVQDDLQTVLLAAARRSLVADIVAVFDRLGIELAQLSVSALALAEHIRDSLEPTAIIALESGAMDVAVVADGQLLFTRSSAIEVAGIARDVAARKFSEEVARSFTAYQNEFRQKPLAHVYLCGSETETADGDWMDQSLIEALEKPVARLHSRLLPAADPDARSYAIAAGMALEALGGALSDINLVPNDRAEKRLQVQRARKQQLIGVGLAAVVIAGAFYLKGAVDDQDKRRKNTEAANKLMDAALKDEKPIQRSYDRVTAFDRVLTKSLDRDHPSVDVLVALNRCLPKSADIWLNQLNFDRGSLMTLRGDSKNSRAVTDLLLNLQASGAFSDVRLSYIADAQDTATPDVVRAVPKTPPVTPLPGLQPTVTMPAPGAAAGFPGAPGVVPGAPGAVGVPGAAGFNPGAVAPGGFNPAGGFNPTGGGTGFGGGNGFGGGRRNRGGFGNPGAFNPGTGTLITSSPGTGVPQGTFNPAGGVQSPQVPTATGVPGGGAPGGVPGQITITAPTQNPQFAQGGAAPTAPAFQQGGVPSAPSFPQQGAASFPQQGAPNFPQQGGAGAPGGGRMVITPDMAAAGVPGRGGFSQAQIDAWRQLRSRITSGAGPSSVNMGVGGSAMPMTPGAVFPAVPAAAAPAPTRPGAATRKPVVAKTAKPTLTGFVITCRLIPNAKLIPPNTRDTVQNNAAPTHVKTAGATTESHAETDNTDDAGDLE